MKIPDTEGEAQPPVDGKIYADWFEITGRTAYRAQTPFLYYMHIRSHNKRLHQPYRKEQGHTIRTVLRAAPIVTRYLHISQVIGLLCQRGAFLHVLRSVP